MRWCAKGEFGGIESFVCLFVTCIIRHKQQHHLFIEQYVKQSFYLCASFWIELQEVFLFQSEV